MSDSSPLHFALTSFLPHHALAARTVRLDGAVDLLAVAGDEGMLFERDGVGLATRGAALRISLPQGLAGTRAGEQVGEALSQIVTCDEVGLPGCGPVAIGALPFGPGAPGELVVPKVIVGRSAEGTSWLTTVSQLGRGSVGGQRVALPVLDDLRAGLGPDAFTLATTISHESWCRLVDQAVAQIEGGSFDKVVLAREVKVTANRPLVPHQVLARLHALYPACTVFSVDGFVGASPELLVRRTGLEVATHPLAGTVPRSGDSHTDRELAAQMLASVKDRAEHQLVVDAVAEALGPVCVELDVPSSPSIVSLRNVAHLGTAVRGRLKAPAATALDLAARLHPTPAVAGWPTEAALGHLQAVEGFDRGRYAGPVGWVDRNGDGDWVVGIRSAQLNGHCAYLYAGVGVVKGSIPEEELAETQLKLQALLAAIVRP